MLMVNCILYLSKFSEAYVQKIMRQISLYSDGEIGKEGILHYRDWYKVLHI